ncbi:MAG: RDD family protein [Clostridia bacterium]|nr:RDD family protein [Clostridia bacterium]
MKRALAFLIDLAITLIPAIILTAIALTLFDVSSDIGLSLFTSFALFTMPLNIIFNMPPENAFTLFAMAYVSFLIIYIIYCLLMELLFKRTVGARGARIICVKENKSRLKAGAVIIRCLIKFISLCCFPFALITVFFKKRRPLYDIICKTEVISFSEDHK